MKKFIPALIGIFTGFANGIFGSGGGTVAVPTMEKFLKTEPHKSHATAIALILPLSAVSAAIYIFKTEVPFSVLIPVTLGSVAGGILGAKFLKKVPTKYLHKIFALFMLAAAVRMII